MAKDLAAKDPKVLDVSVIERRLQGPSVLYEPSIPIPLKDPTWLVRWTNSEISTDHAWRRINIQGWEYASPRDIACALDEVGANERDGRVVRGERGREVLVKMRKTDYAQLQQGKDRENKRITFDKQTLKDAMVGAVGQAHGDQAASFIAKRDMTVIDSRERTNIDE